VAKARRSDQAKAKDATRLGQDGLPVDSFRTLLDDLATLAYNVCHTPLNPRTQRSESAGGRESGTLFGDIDVQVPYLR
jgi:hypothetical protein